MLQKQQQGPFTIGTKMTVRLPEQQDLVAELHIPSSQFLWPDAWRTWTKANGTFSA